MRAPTRPKSRMLRELAARSITTNTTIISKHQKGDSREWHIWEDKLGRNAPNQRGNAKGPGMGAPEFPVNKYQRKSVMELLSALALKGGKRAADDLPSKGLKHPNAHQVKKSAKSQRKRDGGVQGDGSLPISTTGNRRRSVTELRDGGYLYLRRPH